MFVIPPSGIHRVPTCGQSGALAVKVAVKMKHGF
jgi:hypothetical protein